jgi:CRP-like cAMP-binding protein/Fe-S-cluster-containing hydrogenase component 2
MAKPLAGQRSPRVDEQRRAAAAERIERQVAALAMLDVLREAPAPELRCIAGLVTLRVFPAASAIVSEHADAEYLYFLMDGIARVTLHDKDGHEVLLGLLGRGDHFGEGPLFGDHFRRASVMAESNCQVLQIPLDELRQHLPDLPVIATALRAIYRERLVYSTLGRVPLFSQLSPTERGEIAGLLRRVGYARGEAIMRQGEPGDALYLIEDGQVTVEQSEHVIAHLDVGDFVGEMSLLSDQPHNATVRAVTPVDVLVLPGAEFHRLLAQQPALARQLYTAAEERRRAGASMRSDRSRSLRLDAAVRHGLLRGSHLLVRDPEACDPQCKLCEQACTQRHGHARLRLNGVLLDGLDVLDACRQCRFGAECIEVCPADAFRWSDGGALLITERCTGCGDCAPACPYGAIRMVSTAPAHSSSPLWQLWSRLRHSRNPVISLEVMPPAQRADKCNLCEGFEDLACVSACPTGALRLVPVEELFPL